MKRLLISTVTASLIGLGLYAAQTITIRATDAKAHLGRFVIVEDTIAQVSREAQSGFTYLNFGGEFPNHVFRAVIPSAVEKMIGAPLCGVSAGASSRDTETRCVRHSRNPLLRADAGRSRESRRYTRDGFDPLASHSGHSNYSSDSHSDLLPNLHNRKGVREQLHLAVVHVSAASGLRV